MKDMTEGNPSKVLILFSLPMLLSVILQQLYNVVDSVVAGQFVGVDALAAVGTSYPITMIFMAIATGSNIGCSVVISQLYGAKEYERMKTAVSTSLLSILVLSLLLTGIGLVTCQPLMHLLHTPKNIFADSALYLRVYIGGLIFLFLYNICTGVFTALGDSITPLIFLFCSSIGNIILDLLFVIQFKMGVGGVAWATFIAQGISSVLAAGALLIRLRSLKTENAYQVFSGPMLKRISIIAIPSILQQSFISVGNLAIQGLVNSFGSAVIAGYSAAIKLNTFAVTSFTTLGNGLSSFTAQNIGAGKPERVRQGFSAGMRMTFAVVAVFVILFFVFPAAMIRLFINDSGHVALDTGILFLRIVSPFYFVISLKLMADGVLRGAGAMRAFMIATFSDLIFRVVLAFLLAFLLHDSIGIWLSWPIGWIIGTIASFWFYLRGNWKNALSR